jgi:hypothetical protein
MRERKIMIIVDEAKVAQLLTVLISAMQALEPIAKIPLEQMLYKHPDQPLMGWNGHILYVRDVYAARNVLHNTEEMIRE